MKTYTVDFENVTRGQLKDRFLQAFEFKGEFFPREHFSNIIRDLFYAAAQSIDFKHLRATAKCDGEEIFTVKCDTTVDGSRILADISMAKPHDRFRYVRTMCIAE